MSQHKSSDSGVNNRNRPTTLNLEKISYTKQPEDISERTEKSEESSNKAKEMAITQPGEILLPVHPEYSSKSARLSSFKDWPTDKQQKPEDLAEAGLFYVGEEDKTMCYYCGGGLRDWKEEDDPWQQHEMWFGSRCEYIRLKKLENK